MLCGLEIHQRLSGPKLFCSCPCPAPDEPLREPCPHIVRRMRAARGENGATDAAAAFEAGRERILEYVAPSTHACLVEADEEPPHPLNLQHLHAVLALARHAGATLVDEVQVMRKTVADGSNTSGFQRTSLIAVGGSLPSPAGPITLETMCLEEESAGILPSKDGRTHYRIDRLGIPLIEIATAPVFTTPQAAYEGAQAIGMALRMLPTAMRGLGTIRQDVNVSVPGGARVEIKGLQDLSLLPMLIENEVRRQEGLIEISKEMAKRGLGHSAPGPAQDVSKLFASTSCTIISRALAANKAHPGAPAGSPLDSHSPSDGVVLAARLPKMAGLLGRTLYEGRRLGSELSDYAKMAGGVHGLIHSDEDLAKYKLMPQEVEALCRELKLQEQDAFIIIADEKRKAEPAIRAALERARVSGVPKETRKADERGGSSFMRPMAGAHRMYPETDIPPIRISAELMKGAEKQKIETVEVRSARLVSLLGSELGEQMLRSHQFALFEKLVGGEDGAKAGLDPKLVAITLEQTLVSLRREGVAVESISESALRETLELCAQDKITKAVIPEILRELAKTPGANPEKIAAHHHWQRLTGAALEKAWAESGGEMRAFMAKYRLVAEGADVAKLAKKK
ncbi:Glutamyl-tRNA(Gln) amidotransferase subunit E [uncultured archaeon]|nr:Glutamyl-tRNA(Gln) amidotransferase subunit E [uncultured archaeon]